MFPGDRMLILDLTGAHIANRWIVFGAGHSIGHFYSLPCRHVSDVRRLYRRLRVYEGGGRFD